MKVFLILTTGRTGSDYLNYCLDGLDNVITFSGKFKIDDFFLTNLKKLYSFFIFCNIFKPLSLFKFKCEKF